MTLAHDLDAQIEAARKRVVRRKQTDRRIVFWMVFLCGTVGVPWLLGRFVLRDVFFRLRDPDVFDLQVRQDGAYFLTDWLTGCGVVVALAALLLVLRSWDSRVGAIVGAGLCVLIAIGLTAAGVQLWHQSERASAAALRETAYPFDHHYYSCGSLTSDVNGHLWQVQSARIADTDVDGCNRVAIFDGWRQVAQIDLPKGRLADMDESGISNKDVVTIRAASSKQVVVQFNLTKPVKGCRQQGGTVLCP